MHVHEIAKQSGCPSHVVRYYARIGLLTPNRHPENGYKIFRGEDITKLQIIRQCQRLGLSLAEIAELLDAAGHQRPCCENLRAALGRRRQENQDRLHDLACMQRRLDRALASWGRIPKEITDTASLSRLVVKLTSRSTDA